MYYYSELFYVLVYDLLFCYISYVPQLGVQLIYEIGFFSKPGKMVSSMSSVLCLGTFLSFISGSL